MLLRDVAVECRAVGRAGYRLAEQLRIYYVRKKSVNGNVHHFGPTGNRRHKLQICNSLAWLGFRGAGRSRLGWWGIRLNSGLRRAFVESL